MGTAAAISDDFSTLDISQLQKSLQDSGVVRHEEDLQYTTPRESVDSRGVMLEYVWRR